MIGVHIWDSEILLRNLKFGVRAVHMHPFLFLSLTCSWVLDLKCPLTLELQKSSLQIRNHVYMFTYILLSLVS